MWRTVTVELKGAPLGVTVVVVVGLSSDSVLVTSVAEARERLKTALVGLFRVKEVGPGGIVCG